MKTPNGERWRLSWLLLSSASLTNKSPEQSLHAYLSQITFMALSQNSAFNSGTVELIYLYTAAC